MNEITLALLSFGLGIIATIITQIITRRFLLSDARLKRRFDNLHIVRQWMNVYRELFECAYPDILEKLTYDEHGRTIAEKLVFDENGFAATVKDEILCRQIYEALKQYQEADRRLKEAEIKGKDALRFLGENEWLDRITYPIHLSRFSGYIGGISHPPVFVSSTQDMVSWLGWFAMYPRGFPRRIAKKLELLKEFRSVAFDAPSVWMFSVEWSKLDFVKPQDICSIIENKVESINSQARRMQLDEANEFVSSQVQHARETMEQSKHYRFRVHTLLENILGEITGEEKKCLTPKNAG